MFYNEERKQLTRVKIINGKLNCHKGLQINFNDQNIFDGAAKWKTKQKYSEEDTRVLKFSVKNKNLLGIAHCETYDKNNCLI